MSDIVRVRVEDFAYRELGVRVGVKIFGINFINFERVEESGFEQISMESESESYGYYCDSAHP